MIDPSDSIRVRGQLAVLSIFRDLGICAGDALSVAQIAEAWPDYGVRASDLTWVLEGLVRDGLLACTPGVPDRVVLTACGERWFRQQPAWLEYRLLVARAAHVRTSRRQRARKPAARCRRRHDDPPR